MAELDDRLRTDFGFLEERVKGVLLFGSAVGGRVPRDFDVCVVTASADPIPILWEIFHRIDVRGKRYDVWLFEELPLYMRYEVIRNHRVILARDVPALYEYLYFARKLCRDLERRRIVAGPVR
ncbi:MAG: DNA polymerase subunit beta [Planctomycetes bacterium]|nr:DNA polymerase subunit beta [Planctomycetota bacterium]